MAGNKAGKIKLLAIVSTIIVFSGCRGQQIAHTPLERGISTKLQKWFADPPTQVKDSLFPLEIESELQTSLEWYAKTTKLPGAVLAISSAQQTWMGATGTADQVNQAVMQPSDRFRIGNISEMFVAVVSLQLQEEGVLNLEDKITDWLPAKIHQRIPHSNWITVRQLLNHTSGLPDFDAAFQQAVSADPTHRWSISELLEFTLDRQPAAPRGTYSYSTANYLLLQLIVERAVGSSLAEAIQARIIKPLALKNTFVELSAKKPIVHGYQDWDRDGSPEDVTQPLLNTGLGLGGNALVSNAPDLIRFLQALFLENKLLDATSQQKMLSLVDTNSGSYGLGISHTMTRWGEVWGQVSSTTGFSTAIFYLPVHDLIVVSWTNSVDEKASRPLEITEKGLNIVLANPYRLSSAPKLRW